MTKIKKGVWLLVAALISLSLMSGVWAVTTTAKAAPAVSSSPVALDELMARYGASVKCYSSQLSIKNNELTGWATSSYPVGSVIVVPSTVTKVRKPSSSTSGEGMDFSGEGSKTAIVGIYFEADSSTGKCSLQSIEDGAFSGLDNLQFVIIPESSNEGGIKIGAQAFENCGQLKDVVLSKNVKSIGASAFGYAYNLRHISIPTSVTSIASSAFSYCFNLVDVEYNANISAVNSAFGTYFPYAMNIYRNDTKFKTAHGKDADNKVTAGSRSYLYTTENGIVFSKNNKYSGTLATTSGGNASYSSGRWYMVGLAVPENKLNGAYIPDENGDYKPTKKLVALPNVLNTAAARSTENEWNKGVAYDYLDDEGKKVLNSDLTENVTSYDVAARACYMTVQEWGITIPNAVKVIGDQAFLDTRFANIDIGGNVTHIGAEAFRGAERINLGAQQFITVRKSPSGTAKTINVGSGAFRFAASWNKTGSTASSIGTFTSSAGIKRTIIYESYADYNKDTGRKGKYIPDNYSGSEITYMVDINTVVEDGATGQKTPKTVARRLHGKQYNYVPSENDGVNDGRWETGAGVFIPTIEGNSSTVWYSGSDYVSVADESYVNTRLSATTAPYDYINLYTKKIAAPSSLADVEKTYDGKAEPFVVATGLVASEDYNPLTNDYSAVLISYTDSFGSSLSALPSSVSDAGTYVIELRLGQKWGAWDSSVSSALRMTVKVNRQAIDIYDMKQISWVLSNNEQLMAEIPTELFQYADGWYSQENPAGENFRGSRKVLCSFVRYDGSAKTVKVSDNVLYTANVISGDSYIESGRYTMNVTLTMRTGNNYYFREGEYTDEVEQRGIEINSKRVNDTVIDISKTWYIVKQTNWLTDGNWSEESGTEAPSFTIANVSGWTYGSTTAADGTGIVINTPKLAHGGTAGVTFSMTLDRAHIIPESAALPISDFAKYVNLTMPAGTYTVRIKGEEYTDSSTGVYYPPVSQNYELTVAQRKLTDGEKNVLTSLFKGKTFYRAENRYDGKAFLHDYLNYTLTTATSGDIMMNGTLKDLLDTDIHKLRNDSTLVANAWKNPVYDETYYKPLSLTYNLDRMRSSRYYTYSYLIGGHGVNGPADVDSYAVYYQLSGSSCESLWDDTAANADTVRRNYVFNTVIYREVDIPAIQSVDYAGEGGVRPVVMFSPFYSHDAYSADNSYVNAGKHTVTFTIFDTNLSRWNVDGIDDETSPNYREDVSFDASTPGIVKVTFEINPVENRWLSYPHLSSWMYNGFDRNAYLISGRLLYDSQVNYGILAPNDTLLKFENESGITVTEFTVDADGRVPTWVESVLKTLPEADYKLVSRAEEDTNGNFNALVTESGHYGQIHVSEAVNGWATVPSVAAWAVGAWNRNESTPKGVARYGDVTFTITGTEGDSSTVYYRAVYHADTKETEELMIPILNRAEAGWYNLNVFVEGRKGCYNKLEEDVRFQIFLATVDRPANRWLSELMPKMTDWTAGDTPSEPQGTALRGDTTFTYWTTWYNSETRRYERFVQLADKPYEPGYYIVYMVVTVEEDGVEVIQDRLETEVQFQIYERVNKWTTPPSIQGWDMAGAPSTPVAESLFTGTNVEFKYKKKGEDDSLAVAEKPTAKGEYVMIAIARAEYSQDLVAYVNFEITLTVNRWVVNPSIKDYTVEFAPPAPTGEALFGEIVYVYMTRDGAELDGAPTQEGEYTLYARVDVDGYESIEAYYDFTVGPAFDEMLMTTDIILGFIACILATVVIIFAIRRYRQC